MSKLLQCLAVRGAFTARTPVSSDVPKRSLTRVALLSDPVEPTGPITGHALRLLRRPESIKTLTLLPDRRRTSNALCKEADAAAQFRQSHTAQRWKSTYSVMWTTSDSLTGKGKRRARQLSRRVHSCLSRLVESAQRAGAD